MSAETMGDLLSAVDAHVKDERDTALAKAATEHEAELQTLAAARDQAVADRDAARAELAAHMTTHQPDPEPQARKVILGMSAFPNVWDQRLREVGADGITARRIFIDDINQPRAKASLIDDAIEAGMMPILSFKKTPTAANVAALRSYLVSLGVPVTATWAHEPHNDMTPAAFRDGSKTFLGVKAPNVKVGPILNGWLLDNLKATTRANWQDYTSPELLDAWDFLGLDTYSEGTVANPSTTLLCGRAIPKAVKWLAEQGHPDMPILIGEYNGQTGEGIRYAGEQILNTPQVWVACQWNMDHMQDGVLKFNALVGARLDAFKRTKADPRVAR